MSRYHLCQACGCPGVEYGYRLCGNCAVLLDGLEDLTVPPPPETRQVVAAREPRDGKWLVWACNKRGRLREAQRIGREHGFPRNMLQWSPAMVEVAIRELAASRSVTSAPLIPKAERREQ
jgi:hypothetical protein